jgi:predicted DNA-binding ArsR family transcriptional regulator
MIIQVNQNILKRFSYTPKKKEQQYLKKIEKIGTKVLEAQYGNHFEQFYYFKDTHNNHHILWSEDDYPFIELTISSNSNIEEIVKILSALILQDEQTLILKAMLNISELQPIASEIILRGDV